MGRASCAGYAYRHEQHPCPCLLFENVLLKINKQAVFLDLMDIGDFLNPFHSRVYTNVFTRFVRYFEMKICIFVKNSKSTAKNL